MRGDARAAAALRVVRAGPQDTVQDEGRVGHLRFGVPPSGALDADAYHVATALAGAQPGSAAIEFLGASGTYEVVGCTEIVVAVAGAPGPVLVNDRVREGDRAFRLAPGDRVRAGPRTRGQRGYLAVAGGIAVPPVLGSASTHLRGSFGGWFGRALAEGDELPLGPASDMPPERLLPDMAWPADRRAALAGREPAPLRALPGPQSDLFEAPARALLETAVYRVGAHADRMGYRLEGPRLAHARDFNIVSDAIATGSVQVPGDGMPIVLLADRQTTGGFPKIATVITADLPVLAQLGPGDLLRFRLVSRAEAVGALRDRLAWRASLQGRLEPAVRSAADLTSEYLLSRNLVTAVWEES